VGKRIDVLAIPQGKKTRILKDKCFGANCPRNRAGGKYARNDSVKGGFIKLELIIRTDRICKLLRQLINGCLDGRTRIGDGCSVDVKILEENCHPNMIGKCHGNIPGHMRCQAG